jgi:tetratricopeptide (TPR) repeat protein
MIKRIIAISLELVFLCFVCVFPVFCQSDKISIPDIEIKKAEQSFVEEKYGMAIYILRNLEEILRRPEFVNNKNEYLIKTDFILGACYLKLGRNNVTDILFREVLKINPKYEVDQTAYGEDVVQLFEKLKEDIHKETIDKIEETQPPSKNEDIAEAEKASSSVQTPIMNRSSVEIDTSTQTSGIQVRVIKEGAVLKLKPDAKSLTIIKLPLGSLLDVKEILEEWVKVRLLPNQDGIVVVGYIRIEYVEMESQLDK